MKIFKSKLFKLSSEINNILCITLIRCKVNSNNILFEKKSLDIFFILRLTIFIIIVTLARMPRYREYFIDLFIVRIVFLTATFFSYGYFANEIVINVKNGKRLARIWNEIFCILNNQKSTNDNNYLRKQLLIEYVTVMIVAIILLHMDYLRWDGKDLIGYTIPEIITLKSIFHKIFLLAMIKKALTNSNEKIHKANMMNVISATKEYTKLIDLVTEIDDLYGSTYLILTVKAFLFIIHNLYKLIIFYQESFKFPTPHIILSWYMSFVWTPLYTMQLLLFIYYYNGIKTNILKYQILLNNNFCNLSFSEDQVYIKIVSFFLKLILMTLFVIFNRTAIKI